MKVQSARGVRALMMVLIAALMSTLLPLFVSGTAVAVPSSPVIAQVLTPSVVPAATATSTKLSTHCGDKLRWKLALKAQDSDVKFRAWSYTSKKHIRYFCFKMYKMRSGDTNDMGAIVKTYTGKTLEAVTAGPTFTVKAKIPPKKKAYVKPEYNGEYYSTITLKGYGVK